jgi:hypothetical protein
LAKCQSRSRIRILEPGLLSPFRMETVPVTIGAAPSGTSGVPPLFGKAIGHPHGGFAGLFLQTFHKLDATETDDAKLSFADLQSPRPGKTKTAKAGKEPKEPSPSVSNQALVAFLPAPAQVVQPPAKIAAGTPIPTTSPAPNIPTASTPIVPWIVAEPASAPAKTASADHAVAATTHKVAPSFPKPFPTIETEGPAATKNLNGATPAPSASIGQEKFSKAWPQTEDAQSPKPIAAVEQPSENSPAKITDFKGNEIKPRITFAAVREAAGPPKDIPEQASAPAKDNHVVAEAPAIASPPSSFSESKAPPADDRMVATVDRQTNTTPPAAPKPKSDSKSAEAGQTAGRSVPNPPDAASQSDLEQSLKSAIGEQLPVEIAVHETGRSADAGQTTSRSSPHHDAAAIPSGARLASSGDAVRVRPADPVEVAGVRKNPATSTDPAIAPPNPNLPEANLRGMRPESLHEIKTSRPTEKRTDPQMAGTSEDTRPADTRPADTRTPAFPPSTPDPVHRELQQAQPPAELRASPLPQAAQVSANHVVSAPPSPERAEIRTSAPADTVLPSFPEERFQPAHLVDRAGHAEMRLGVSTETFGSVQVHTVIRDSQVGLTIGSERGDLKSFLAAEVPGLESNLRQHDLHFSDVRFVSTNFSSSGNQFGGAGSQSQGFQQGRSFFPTPAKFSLNTEESLVQEIADRETNGLNIHA